MKIAVASDHRGYAAKQKIAAFLNEHSHTVEDFGCESPASCDYPEHGFGAAECVARGDAQTAFLFCGTGIGMSITANKVRGIRAALCHDELTAELARQHNNANVLCLPADLLGDELLKRVVDAWLRTGFEGGRHERRLNRIAAYEQNGATADCTPKSKSKKS